MAFKSRGIVERCVCVTFTGFKTDGMEDSNVSQSGMVLRTRKEPIKF